MRLLLAGVLLVVASPFVRAEEKIDPALIVGKWEMEPRKGFTKEAGGMTFEFFADGKFKGEMRLGKSALNLEGTYTLDGDTMRVVTKTPKGEESTTSTVNKLTDKELVITAKSGRKDTFTRVKK